MTPGMPTTTTIEWTSEKLERFRKLIHSQTRLDAIVTFEGHEFLVGYGRYLIQYLDMKFGGAV
jgi:hypothetical protein